MPVSILNAAHLHIAMNHAPIVGAIFSLLLLLGGWWRGSDAVVRAGLVAFVATGLTAVPTYLTGDPAADLVRGLPEVVRQRIREHDTWATYFAVAIGVTSVLSLWLLWRHRAARVVPRGAVTLVLVLGLVASALGGWVGLLGGQIHHEEARPGFVPPPRPAGARGGDAS